jgi:hypothetical protein
MLLPNIILNSKKSNWPFVMPFKFPYPEDFRPCTRYYTSMLSMAGDILLCSTALGATKILQSYKGFHNERKHNNATGRLATHSAIPLIPSTSSSQSSDQKGECPHKNRTNSLCNKLGFIW